MSILPILALALSVLSTPPAYHIEDLGNLGGELANGLGINAHGDVCGQAEGPPIDTRAFFWSEATGMLDLGSFVPEHTYGRADGVNDHGYVVGGAMGYVDPGYMPKPFIWHESTGMLDLGIDPFGFARDINNANQVCGIAGNRGAFVWDFANGPVFFRIGGPQGYGVDANAINENGIVAGMGWDANLDYMAYTYDIATGQVTILPGLDDSNTAWGINDRSVVVGSSALPNNQRLPVYWTAGELVEIPLLSEPSWIVHGEAERINESDWIVGADWAEEPGHNSVAWLYIDGEKWALNDLIVDDGTDVWEITFAADVNDAGQITGIAIKNGIQGVAFRMTPVAVCAEDLDGDGEVGFGDLLELLASWGPCSGCPADLDGDGEVGLGDLLRVLSAWGPCEA